MAYPSDAISQSFYSDIDPILPSDTFTFPSEPTESQTTELTPLPLPLPQSIERVGDQTKPWALWTEMTKTDFIEWWLTTQYGSTPDAQRIHWDGKRYKSDIWSSFHQIANIQTGKPKVMCKQCGVMFGHPALNGTTALRRHQTNGSCRRLKGKQTNIQQLIQKVVCLLKREKNETKVRAKYIITNLLFSH
jgi:hypothetical protein